MKKAPLLAALALGGAGLALAPSSPAAPAGPVTPVLIWTRTVPGINQSSPTLGELTDPSVLIGGTDGKVYAFSLSTGADEPGWPQQTSNPILASPSAAPLGPGGDTVFVNSGTDEAGQCSGGGTYAFSARGAPLWHHVATDPVCPNLSFVTAPMVGDITGSGATAVVDGALGLQNPAYDATSGAMLGGWPFWTGDTVFATPSLLTGQGAPQVIMGSDFSPGAPLTFRGGAVEAVTGSGQMLWKFNTDETVHSSPAIGVIDGSGQPSIAFGTGNYWVIQPGMHVHDSTKLFVLNSTGALKWSRDLGALTLAGPAMADLTGNGTADVIESTYQAGPAGSAAAAGKIWAFDGAGNPLPGWAGRPSGGTIVLGSVATADLNGDGAQDVIAATDMGIFAFDGRTANQLFVLDHYNYFQNTPLITDDGGGAVGITVANAAGVVQHWRVSPASHPQLGSVGWPMFHHDPRHTGNLATAQPAPPPPPLPANAARLGGVNRDLTSVAVSAAEFRVPGSAQIAVLARDDQYADALTGGPLAVHGRGPLLLTGPGGLNASVAAELSRAVAPGSTVYLLGGSSALSSSVDASVAVLGFTVQRVAGADRFQTAVAVADALGDPATIFEATGVDSTGADALCAGPPASARGAAILLTNGSAQASETAGYIAAHPGTRMAVGGPAAAADPGATAEVGSDRFATCAKVANDLFVLPAIIGVANGLQPVDGLAGGVLMGAIGGPLVLVDPGHRGTLPAALGAYLSSTKSLKLAAVFGQQGAVDSYTAAAFANALGL